MWNALFERLGFRCSLQAGLAILLIPLLIEQPILQAECVARNDRDSDGQHGAVRGSCKLGCGQLGPEEDGTNMLGGTTQGGAGGSNCSSCGSGQNNRSFDIFQGFRADRLDRYWIPQDTASYSGFTPGFYSQFDSKVAIFPETGGTTITFLNVFTQKTDTFVDGLNGDTQDGVFHDLQRESSKKLEMKNSSGTVVSNPSQAATVVVTHWEGGTETFQVFDLDPSPTESDLAGRLTQRKSREGKELNVTYQSWTQTQIDASPERQWQINTASDAFGNSLTFAYDSTQYAGRWCVSSVTRNDSRAVEFTYDSDALASIEYADGSVATFAYSQNTTDDTTVVSINDPADKNANRVFEIANNYSSSGTPPDLGVCVPGMIMLRSNHDGEMEFKRVMPVNQTTDQEMIISEGRAMVYYGDGTRQNITAYSESGLGDPGAKLWNVGGVRYVSYKPAAATVVFVGYDTELDTLVFGADATEAQLDTGRVPTRVDENGRETTYLYTSDGDVSKITYTADSTYEQFSYNSFGQKTRERSRDGSVVLHTYDSQGHLLTTATGLVEQSGSDVQTSSYAVTTYSYYGSTHTNAGMVQYEMGPLYNSATPTLHRTDYEYDSYNRITKITGPAATSGGSRPETVRTYNSNGLLATEVNPLSQTTSFTYDAMGRLTQTSYPDSTTDQTLYGATNTANAGRVIKTKNRSNIVTSFEYDDAGRLITQTVNSASDSNILDGQTDTSPVTDVNLKTVTEFVYKAGSSSLKTQVVVNGAKTDYVYDDENRLTEVKQYPRSGLTLTSKKGYEGYELLYDEDPYGRRKYYGYRDSDGTLIRTVTCTVPESTLTNFAAVWALTRSSSANATYIIHDAIRDADGHLTQVIDGRGNETRYEYNAQGRETVKKEAYGTSIEAKTETYYDLAGRVTEVRKPRYFDSTDTNGYQKANETWTYNGRGQVATHTESPSTAETATESFTYDLAGKQATHTDFNGKVWTTLDNACCGKQMGSQDPLGNGSIRNSDSMGRSVHSIMVSDIASITDFANPTDAKTLSESTTKYDGLGRVSASTTWLSARGTVDPTNPPIAGLGSVAVSQGLSTFYLYDNNLSDGVGLDSSTGLSVIKQSGTSPSGSFNVSLSTAISKLADTQGNGGAGISFSSTSPGSASVVVNAEDEVTFTISDAAGRQVMSGKLDNYKGTANALLAWSSQLHDQTTSVSGYGTVLESRSIDSLGNATKSRIDAAGRTIQSLNQLSKITTFTYDAGGNQLSVRDPNNVGADMVYDQLGRNTSRTDTASDVTSTTYDKAGNAIKQTDAKSKDTLIAFDARGRRKSTTDRISGVTSFTYLAGGQLESLTDAENQTTSYTYDDRGAKLTEQYPDHTASTTPGQIGYGIVTFVYDAAGRVSRKQDQQGDTVTHSYDLAGRMTQRDYRLRVNSPSGTVADNDVFTFDRAGRMLTAYSGRYGNTITYTYDQAGRKGSEAMNIGGVTYTTTPQYNSRGELTQYTYPDGSVVARTYHATGNLNEVKLSGTALDTRTYDDGGRLSTSAYSNGITSTFSYGSDNLVSSINVTHPSGIPADEKVPNLAYTWDDNKNKLSEVHTGVNTTVNGFGFNAADTSYDFEDRLTQWKRANGNENQSWSLTAVGDWSSHTRNGTTTSRTHGPTHELLAIGSNSLTYDAKGNLTQDTSRSPTQNYTWDFDNKLKAVDIDNNSTNDVTFEYDALGRRVARTQGSDAVVLIQVDQQTIADYPRGGAASSPTYRYFWGSYIDELIARKATGTSGELLYSHRTQQYSVVAISNASGSVVERVAYTAYGQPTFTNASGSSLSSSAKATRYTYTGREWDPSLELHHFRARWMSGASGRFMGRDPIGYLGSEWLLYEYVDAKPLHLSDFSGLFEFPPGVNPESLEDLINFIKKLQRELPPEEFRKKLEEIRNSLRSKKTIWSIWITAEKRAGPRNPNKPGRGSKRQTGGRKGICKLPLLKYGFLLECQGACAYYYNFCLDSAQADFEMNLTRCNGLPFQDRQACIDNEFYIWQLNATECGATYAACGLLCLLPVDVGIE